MNFLSVNYEHSTFWESKTEEGFFFNSEREQAVSFSQIIILFLSSLENLEKRSDYLKHR